MPEVSSPDTLGLEPFDQLADDRLDAITLVLERRRPAVLFFGAGAERSQ